MSPFQRERRPALIPNLDNLTSKDAEILARSRGIQTPPLVPPSYLPDLVDSSNTSPSADGRQCLTIDHEPEAAETTQEQPSNKLRSASRNYLRTPAQQQASRRFSWVKSPSSSDQCTKGNHDALHASQIPSDAQAMMSTPSVGNPTSKHGPFNYTHIDSIYDPANIAYRHEDKL
ncbi:MAG: hypothetical protein M1816_007559 [Peltula sp. TS41687]|nr:MAG: hypothetical protein M1816_007559 [Peltula sp. TS41687]